MRFIRQLQLERPLAMLIVLEGPDAAGKSTLAKFLVDTLGFSHRHSGGPGKRPGEIYERIDAMADDPGPTVYDRHPCVSQNIYLDALGLRGEYVDDARLNRFYGGNVFIIYCRPLPDALKRHEMSEFATSDYHKHVERNYDRLTHLYDKWALKRANLVYRIGDDMGMIATQVRARVSDDAWALQQALREMRKFEPMRDIEDFHKKYELAYGGKPRMLPEDLAEFRTEFMHEELGEYEGHTKRLAHELQGDLFGGNPHTVTHHLEGLLDSLVDLTYVVLGTAHLHGFDFRAAWQRVHEANMKKVRASSTMRGKRGDSKFDIIKPPGWKAPSHTDLVSGHVHQPAASPAARRA